MSCCGWMLFASNQDRTYRRNVLKEHVNGFMENSLLKAGDAQKGLLGCGYSENQVICVLWS